jgi:DNA repair protein RecN (Recombination protein N)
LLENLHIVNYALIEELELDFSNGMNTLTGETGAGKSILAGALGLLLGAKATTASIRNGCDQARVSGTFLLPPKAMRRGTVGNGLRNRESSPRMIGLLSDGC